MPFGGVLVLLLIGFFNSLSAQSDLADSLLNILKKSRPDTNKVLLLDELGWELKTEKPDEARRYLEDARKLAIQLNYKTGEGKAWNDLGVLEAIHGNQDAALAAYQKALDIRLQIGDKKGVASIYNNIANILEEKGDYEEAMKNYKKSQRIREELLDTARVARLQYNMGLLHEKMGNYPEALELILQYLIFAERSEDREAQAYGANAMGNIQYELEQLDEALDWYKKALVIFRELEMDWEVSSVLNNMANIQGDLAEQKTEAGDFKNAPALFDSAIVFEKEVIALRTQLNDEGGLAEAFNNLGVVYKDLGSFFKKTKQEKKALEYWELALDYFQKALSIREKLDDKRGIIEVYNGFGDVWRRREDYNKALDYTHRYLALAREIGDSKFEQNAYKDLSKVYAELGDYEKAYEYRKQYDELRYLRLDEQRIKDVERRQALYGDQQKELEIERQQQRNALLDAELKRQEAEIRQAAIFRNSLIGGAVALLLLAGLLYNRNRIKTKANQALTEKNEIIETERRRSDELLLNILPEKTAQELKEHGKAQAQHYESVTVLFSDFKSFTTIAERLTPEQLVQELDECFRAFDDIVSRFGIEKIKTIGDAYMCVGGLPETSADHASRVVHAAIAMQAYMHERRQSHPFSFEMRIGIHSGPVVAGIVGSKKFAYDIWGDTVNLAARMEQNSEPNKINISKSTFDLVQSEFRCTPRGKIHAKNKGELEMFFVEG